MIKQAFLSLLLTNTSQSRSFPEGSVGDYSVRTVRVIQGVYSGWGLDLPSVWSFFPIELESQVEVSSVGDRKEGWEGRSWVGPPVWGLLGTRWMGRFLSRVVGTVKHHHWKPVWWLWSTLNLERVQKDQKIGNKTENESVGKEVEVYCETKFPNHSPKPGLRLNLNTVCK